jgi:hypothetical protein
MTRGRVGKQETLKWIPKKWLAKTWLVCPANEMNMHPHNTIAQPKIVTNYSEKFQWIYDGMPYFPQTTHVPTLPEKVVIMDDDLYFSEYRETPDEKGFMTRRLCVIKDPERLTPMFDLMETMLEKIPLVGVHPRMMAQNAKTPFEWNSKIVTIQGINRRLVPKGLQLAQHPILADVRLNCEILSRGLPNARITTHFVDWLPSQSSGGCDYRTADMQKDATGDIAAEFAPYAQQVIKTPKVSKWLGDSRYDLKVRWKDLYNDAPRASLLLDSGTGSDTRTEG